MSVDIDRVKKLLGNGLSPTITAETVGCDISYISQLLANETFATEVAALRAKDLLRFKETDERYDKIEELLLKKLEDLLPLFLKPRDILAAIQVVNGAKRKVAGTLGADLASGQVVRLDLPPIIVNHYKINMVGGVVEVGGRSLTPLPSSVLMKHIEDKSKKITVEHEPSNETNSENPAKFIGKVTSKNVPSERVISADSI